MKEKELFIHAGTHKTGSSALQTSLICNQHLLQSNDMHFIEYSLLENAHILCRSNYGYNRAGLEIARICNKIYGRNVD